MEMAISERLKDYAIDNGWFAIIKDYRFLIEPNWGIYGNWE